MNPDQPHTPPDAPLPHDALSSDEARVLAVLLGEASPFEREAVEELLSRRPDLRAYRDRTAALLEQLPAAARPDSAPELRLDPDRRAALLAKLRRPAVAASAEAPAPFPRRSNVVMFFRTALSSAPKYAAILAVLLILASMMVPLGKKVRYAERAPREQDAFVFDAPGGAAADSKAASEPDLSVAPTPAAPAVARDGFGVNAGVDSDSGYVFRGKEQSGEAVQSKMVAPQSLPESSMKSYSGKARIVSKGERADIALPAAAPAPSANFADGLSSGGLSSGGLSKGSGGGVGGAEGTGIGIGKGGPAQAESESSAEAMIVNETAAARGLAAGYVSDSETKEIAQYDSDPATTGNRTLDTDFRANREAKPSDKESVLKDRPVAGKRSKVPGTTFAEPAPAKPKSAEPVLQTETLTADNAWSTFSLNVSDVSFRLAGEAARRGAYPDPSGIRTEEFVNAQRFRDPAPLAHEAVSLLQEQARHPFAHNRTLLRLSLRTAAEGRAAGSPLHLVVLLDASGSMERADRRDTVAAALNALADNLRAGDKVSVIGFSRSTRLLIDRMDGTDTRPLRELAKSGVPAEGGTNLENALATAYAELARRAPSGAGARVLLLTDGAANLGDADPARLAAVVEANRRQGRALDCFGIGFDGYNDVMLENLSRKGDGRYAYLNNVDEARSELGAKLAGALRPFANDVKVQVEFNPARVASWRLLGYEKHRLRKQDFRDNTVDAAELAAAESGTAVYSLEIKPDGAGDLGTVRVRYRVPGTQDYREREWGVPNTGAPAFADAPEGVRLAACAAFVAECYADNPNAAGTDRAELRKQVARLAASRPGDAPLTTLRLLADRLAATPAK